MITDLDIRNILLQLARKRPIFHSEADFQHALAMALDIAAKKSGFDVRLERPLIIGGNKLHVDIWLEKRNHSIPIELKYFKKRVDNLNHNDELFDLSNGGAQDLGRYDFLKDIQRIEQIINAGKASIGYCLALTNDPLYWKSSTKDTIDKHFRIHEGKTLSGKLEWIGNPAEGTTRGRDDPLVIEGSYNINWKTYHKFDVLDVKNNLDFRWLLVTVVRA